MLRKQHLVGFELPANMSAVGGVVARPRLPQEQNLTRVDDKLRPGLVGERDAGDAPQEDGTVEGLHCCRVPPRDNAVLPHTFRRCALRLALSMFSL